MSYIGYSEQIPLFVKLLIDEFGNDYEGDSYFTYFEKIKSFLLGEISSTELLEFFDESNFCIFELDHLIKNINEFVQDNISYKQKLNKILTDNIESESSENRSISIKGLSLLFDDFVEIYNENIFDYESFYISIFGVFINLSQDKFMEFINDVIKYNSLTFEDFYFLVNFLKDIVEFKYLNKYVKEFILYSEDYLDVVDDSFERISILMFLTFKLNKTFNSLCNDPKNDFWSKDKRVILAVLKLFSNYCREYNLVFIDQIDEHNKKFIENRDIIYIFLKYLTEFIINKDDCKVILGVYSRLMLDYKEYESVKKVTNIVKYLVSPIFKNENLDILVTSDTQDVMNVLSFYFLDGNNYVDLFVDRCNKYGFNKEISLYILKLILSEKNDTKKKNFVYFINKVYEYLLDDFVYSDENLFNYLLWITNDIINNGRNNIKGLEKVLSLLIKNKKLHNDQVYRLISNFIYKFDYETTYSFEGKSFYKFILSDEKNVYYGRIDREYFFVKYVFSSVYSSDVLTEKEEFLKKINKYFKNVNALNRDDYYKFLVNNKYFDIYKFEILDEIQENKFINEEVLKKECDFLIYDSPNEEGLKFGILLSSILNNNYYEDTYKEIIFKVNYGDIFSRIHKKFRCFDVDNILSLHESCVFSIKWEIYNNINENLVTLRSIVLKNLENYYDKLNIYSFIYIIVFSDYLNEMNAFNDINSNTFKLKTFIKLIEEEVDESISSDVFIYEIFNKCFNVYTSSFISLTQFEVLESLYVLIENKYIKSNSNIRHKDIESFNSNDIEIDERLNFKFNYSEVLKKINRAFKSSEADEYYENIFISQNIDLIINILTNESKFYNETMDLFYKLINKGDNLNVLNEIYKKSLGNIFVGKIFIKLISYYPNIMLNILKQENMLDIYIKILECAF